MARRGRFRTKEQMPADGVSLADEPFDAKAGRMLRTMRAFVASKHGVTAFKVDGQVVMLVKYNPAIHPADADTSTDLDL